MECYLKLTLADSKQPYYWQTASECLIYRLPCVPAAGKKKCGHQTNNPELAKIVFLISVWPAAFGCVPSAERWVALTHAGETSIFSPLGYVALMKAVSVL
jgi:hypothetical protein